MGYLGTKPANSPLTSELIPDGMIGTSDLANGAVTQDKLSTLIAPKGTPAFRAYRTTNQSVNNTTSTKIIFNAEDFDTNSNYDTSTGRFTPTVAGYYQVNASLQLNNTTSPLALIIEKNGTTVLDVTGGFQSSQINSGVCGSICLYLNGSTDYVEIYAYHAAGGTRDIFGYQSVTFSASMVRGA